MTITPYGAGSASGSLFVSLRRDLDDLSRQLTSGQKSETYGGLGVERRVSLDARAHLSALAGYDQAIGAGDLRLKVMTQGVEALSKTAGDVKASLLMDPFAVGPEGKTAAQSAASQQFASAIDILNGDLNGQFLFGGRATDRPPLASASAILDGDAAAGRAGLKQLIAERNAADLGPGSTKLGRLGLSYNAGATSLTLAENGDAQTRANFGFLIQGATSSNPAAIGVATTASAAPDVSFAFASQPKDGDIVRVYANRPDGHQDLLEFTARTNPAPGSTTEFGIGPDAAASAANLRTALAGQAVASAQSAAPPGVSTTFTGGTAGSVSLDVAAQPSEGDVVRFTLGLRDGTQTTIELTARQNPDPASTADFAIGATPAQTAANLTARLGAAIDREARTTLSAASAQVAAADFFAGSATPGREPRRIGGSPPFESATGFSSTAAGRTVIWYAGDDAASSPRDTALVRIDKGQSVGIGAQANEPGIRGLLSQLAVLASATFSADATDQSRYLATTERVRTALIPAQGGQTLEGIGTDLGQASATMAAAKDRHAGTQALLQSALDGVESASPEQVGAQILQLQTRLQASYATSSLLSKLSLVNYMT